MTATDELRAMLDERGVEHFDGTECTLWGYEQTTDSTGCYRCAADEVGEGFMTLRMHHLTPEQAIAATLGAGTCKARLYEPEYGSSDCTICECGEINDISANYCNRCGRRIKVVWE